MKANKIERVLFRLLKNSFIQATLAGLAIVAPFILYATLTNSIIAPLNIVAGWDVSAAKDDVVAPIPSDVTQQMLPFRQYIKDSLTTYHELPLWNNKSFAGDVFLANPINAVLSPFNFLLYFIDIYTYQNFIVLFGLFLMGFCMYLLLRQLSLSIIASFLGAIAFSLAPFSLFWSIYGIISIPMAGLPLVLYLYSKWKEQSKPLNRYLLFIALTLGITVYTGHIQIVILPYIVLFLAVCYDLLFTSLGIKKAIHIFLAVIAAILIGAAQIIPMVQQAPLSHRSQETTMFSPKPWDQRLVELSKIPQAYDLSSGPHRLGNIDRRELLIGQVPGILFILSFVVVAFEVIRRKKVHTLFFYSILFVFGAFWQWNDFPQTLLNSISPTFRSIATDYFVPITLLGMSVLAAYGLDWLRQVLFKKTKKTRIGVMQWALLSIPVMFVVIMSIPQLMLSKVDTLSDTYYLLYYGVLLLALITYGLYTNSQAAKVLFGSTLVIVALMQGWALYRVSQPIVPREITVIKNEQLNYITSHENNTPTIIDYAHQLESVFYDTTLVNGYDSLYSSSILGRIQAINHPNVTPPTYRNNALVINNVDKPDLLKNLGVSYILNKKPVSGYNEKIPGVYKADQPASPIYFAHAIRNQTKDDQLETIKKGDVIYREVPIDGNYPLADPSSTVTYHRTPNSLTIETSSPNGGLLFIGQTYNKDWQGRIDQQTKIDILPAYYDFSAIQVPSGSHTIKLEYAPGFITFSVALSAFALMVTLVALGYMMRNVHTAKDQ